MSNTVILVMGLSGSGKTTFAKELAHQLNSYNFTVDHLNADDLRTKENDWDFSFEGRIRQAERMSELAQKSHCNFVICDFIAPLKEQREHLKPRFTIWMDTIKNSNYPDTDLLFSKPDGIFFKVENKDQIKLIAKNIADFLNMRLN